MKKRKPKINFSDELLRNYEKAAIINAKSLLAESEVLFQNNFYPRAYFLAVAAIEEIGKGAIAYRARGRNLKAANVQHRLNIDLQNHSAKINAAFHSQFASMSPKMVREEWKNLVNLMIALQRGREPSMYSGVNQNGKIYIPINVVTQKNASDSVELATFCFQSTRRLLKTNDPIESTPSEDKFYSLGSKVTRVLNDENFGEFLLHILEQDNEFHLDIPTQVVVYYEQYFSRRKKFSSKD